MFEECRFFLYNWSLSILDPRYAVPYDGGIDYFIFNTSGHLEHYKRKSLTFPYEIPCNAMVLDLYVKVYVNLPSFIYTPNHDNCNFLYSAILRNVRKDGKFIGPYYTYCFRKATTPDFAVKVEPIEAEFNGFMIQASDFYEQTPDGLVFRSPTLSEFRLH